jgi:hypothetical protein
MANKDRSVIQKRCSGCAKNEIKQAEIQTEGGLQGCALITEDLICEWLPKDNPFVATQLLKLGIRMFLYNLAGYEVKIQPTQTLFVNDPDRFTDNYRRYIEGQFRTQLGFTGTPLRLIWRGKREREAERVQSNRATKV